jgi:hypothetical protein
MNHHDLKTYPANFHDILTRDHGLSIRRNDRDYQTGGTCRFFEWKTGGGGYTGQSSQHYKVVGIIQEHVGVKIGYVILLLEGPWGRCGNNR